MWPVAFSKNSCCSLCRAEELHGVLRQQTLIDSQITLTSRLFNFFCYAYLPYKVKGKSTCFQAGVAIFF